MQGASASQAATASEATARTLKKEAADLTKQLTAARQEALAAQQAAKAAEQEQAHMKEHYEKARVCLPDGACVDLANLPSFLQCDEPTPCATARERSLLWIAVAFMCVSPVPIWALPCWLD
jgi:hypothetical protein